MHKRIYEMAAQAISPSPEEEPLLSQLCSAAEEELRMGLKTGITAADCGSLYIFAAALMASSDLMLLRSVDSAQEFTVGDVSVKQPKTSAIIASSTLRRQALAVMAPFRDDDRFAFMEVPG